MDKLSVCIIVKNEERVLGRCLSCAVQFADELIVIDTGSTDRSVEIARDYTENVYIHPWQGSFAEARNFSYSKSTGDYIMWMDADDVVSDDNISRINELKHDVNDADVVFTIYKSYSATGLTDYILRDRIMRRSAFNGWLFDIHEAIPIDSTWNILYRTDIEIIHKKEYINEPDRNMGIFIAMEEAGREFSLFEKSNFVKELCKHEQIDRALEEFDKIFRNELNPEMYAYAFDFIMTELVRTERWKECLDRICEAEERIASTARLLFFKGLCKEKLGDIESAEVLYRNAVTMEEDFHSLSIRYTGFNDYYPYLRLSELSFNRGDRDEAFRLLKCAGDAYPNAEEWKKLRFKYILLGNK